MNDERSIWISRREFLRAAGLAGAALSLPMGSAMLFPRRAAAAASEDSPIAPVSGEFSSTEFNGDDVRHPHELLWNIEAYIKSKGGRPAASAATDVVVVGGGIAGLLSAYYLRDSKPLVLEMAERFGGNSKSEVHNGSYYSIGAAYITVPEPGDAVDGLFRELGIQDRFRHEKSEEATIEVRGRGLFRLWNGQVETGEKVSFREAEALLTSIYEKAFPAIPRSEGDPLSREQLLALDSMTAEQWLKANLPGASVAVWEYFQLYCWSSFGGSLDELSAAQFLNFVAAEVKGVVAFPGGNGFVANALVRKLRESGAVLYASSLVLEVVERNGFVEVLYEDSSGSLRLVQAKAVVVASPKYVARSIVKGLDRERDSLWKSLPYRAYIVANVLLGQRVSSPAFDIYCLEGKIPSSPRFGERTDRPVTDFCFGGWAQKDSGGGSVLTFYRPLPFDGGRALVVSPTAHARHSKEILEQLASVLKDLGISEQVQGIRLTRWGHSVPLARPGYALDERIGAPLGRRIHFANQDNYMNPAFESGLNAALRAAAGARAAL